MDGLARYHLIAISRDIISALFVIFSYLKSLKNPLTFTSASESDLPNAVEETTRLRAVGGGVSLTLDMGRSFSLFNRRYVDMYVYDMYMICIL